MNQELTTENQTPPQNAGEKLDNAMDEKRGEERMERRQLAGVVEQQTQSHRPSATDPEGMPPAVTGREVEDKVKSN